MGIAAVPMAASTTSRRFGFVARTSRAPSSNAGATTTSRKIETSRSASARSTVPVTATTPPNAETGSPASAASQASSRVARSAAPQGFVCLTMTTAGPRIRRPSDAAADASRTLLYESALPWSGGSPLGERSLGGPRLAVRAAVARGGLVGVLAVAERLHLLEGDGEGGRVRILGAGQAGLRGSATPASCMRPGSSAAIRAS